MALFSEMMDEAGELKNEIATLKDRLAQSEADRDSYKEQMLRAQIELHAFKRKSLGDFDGF